MYELEPWQRQAVQQAIDRFGGRCLLVADPGLGKTLMALEVLRILRQDAWPAIVVCPASVKWGWQREASRHLNLSVRILSGRKPQLLVPSRQHEILVINYDIVHHWRKQLAAYPYRTLVLDECQYLIDNRRKRTKACLRLGRRVPYVFALSATPLLNRPRELYPTLHLLRPTVFGQWWDFAQRYCEPTMGRYGWEFNGAANLSELNRRMRKSCMVRICKEKVLTDQPTKTRRVELMDLSDPAEYQHAIQDFAGWLKQQDPDRAKRARFAL